MKNSENADASFKLIEGKTYSFKINGRIILHDGLDYLVLIDPGGVKHLLEYSPYEAYHLQEKGTVKCRVDKINCTGKIYLEPLHPHYKLNQVYSFKLLGYTHDNLNDNHTEQVAVFEDFFKNHILISASEVNPGINKGAFQQFRIKKIKRGKVQLSNVLESEDFSSFINGHIYTFKIKDFVSRVGDAPHFVLESEDGQLYKIREKFYKNYGLRKGEKCQCAFIDEADEEFLEPKHPYFNVGDFYDFNILKIEEIAVYPNMKKRAFFLENNYGKHIVLLEEEVNPDAIKNNQIRGKVIGIRKSRPLILLQ